MISKLVKISEFCFADADYKAAFEKLGLNCIDAVFSFDEAVNLSKQNLAAFRSRLRFELDWPAGQAVTVFLKRYDRPPLTVQLVNWLNHRKIRSCAALDFEPSSELNAAGINTPQVLLYGEQRAMIFEKRSFVITQKIADADSLERRLPKCFTAPATAEKIKLKKNFITELAGFVRKFHQTGYRHRDLYFSHIFCNNSGDFYLIDLARAFKPLLFTERFRIKDIAQVHYSAPAEHFSGTDRLRFYLHYSGHGKLTPKDKTFIRRVIRKAGKMAAHDIKHGKDVPFLNRSK